MRELDECRAEVFRRSENRIKKQRKNRKRLLAWGIPVCLFLTICYVSILPSMMTVGSDKAAEGENFANGNKTDGSDYYGNAEGDDYFGPSNNNWFDPLDNFSFSLTWGCYAISSYDSETGKLVKTKDATTYEGYVTTYILTKEQKQRIYNLILNLNVNSYPDNYNPHKDGVESSLPMTLILSVKMDAFEKTIRAENIALTYESNDYHGQRFLNVCKEIRDILIETDEWKALPEYKFFYYREEQEK